MFGFMALSGMVTVTRKTNKTIGDPITCHIALLCFNHLSLNILKAWKTQNIITQSCHNVSLPRPDAVCHLTVRCPTLFVFILHLVVGCTFSEHFTHLQQS